MKKSLLAIVMMATLAITFGGSSLVFAQTNSSNGAKTSMNSKTPKILIVYFSHSGNTKIIAEQIKEITGGDLSEIVTVDAYPKIYNETTAQARKELDKNYRPPLTSKVENIEAYEVIILGYPNWWGTMPMPLFTFLDSYDLSGKTIVPFCTHEGSGLGRSLDDLKKTAPKATIQKGLAIRGSGVNQAREDVRQWLNGLGLVG